MRAAAGTLAVAVLFVPAFALTTADPAAAQYQSVRYRGGEWKEEYKYGGREYKFERKRAGEWKEEYKYGRCEVKRERTSSGEFKQEYKCD
jgi:hypothetical protein